MLGFFCDVYVTMKSKKKTKLKEQYIGFLLA